MAFERMRQHKLKMNPLKCAFGVSAGNCLGFLVHQRGIELDQNKAKAIIEAKPPTTKKELQRFLGQVGYLRRFIANHAGKTHVFSPLLKLKGAEEFKWTELHQLAFKGLKSYLANPPVLMPPIKKRPLRLYLSASEESIGSLLAQNNEWGKEQAIYYLSRVLTPVEFENLHVASGRVYNFSNKFDQVYAFQAFDHWTYWKVVIGYIPQKAVKGRAVVEFLADHLSTNIDLEVCDKVDNLYLDYTPWTLMFDGSSTHDGGGAGIVIISPKGRKTTFSFFLDFKCTNNQAEYEALIIGLEILLELKVEKANDLAQLASRVEVPLGVEETLITIKRRVLPSVESRYEVAGHSQSDEPEKIKLAKKTWEIFNIDMDGLNLKDWRTPIIQFLQEPSSKVDKRIQLLAPHYILIDENLYKKSKEDGLLLRCLGKNESMRVMTESHLGICGAHQAGIKIRWLLRRFGIPETITTDRGLSFVSSKVLDYCAECGVQVISSTPYFAQSNGQAKASNKVILNILEKMMENHPKE
ncbi:uncharacterized protein LOC132270362 [Cornus florida]|uniref:uncharacterized protein LOC132270362 n=1 Tax=Cornus florida TaxID=4283 RepID=UPI002899D231|nr:uncharacterized protein LOC132270362 [Cornus florida]